MTDWKVSTSFGCCLSRGTTQQKQSPRGPLPVYTVIATAASLNVTLAQSSEQDSEYTCLGYLEMPRVLTQI